MRLKQATFISFCWLSVLILDSLYAVDATVHSENANSTPWFTGPLLAPTGRVIKSGHYNLEPYLYCQVRTGLYDREGQVHTHPNFFANTFQFQTKIGLTPKIDCQAYPQFCFNETEGQSYANVGDISIGIGYAVLEAKTKDPWPSIRLLLETNVPLGKYQHLKPSRKRTDAIGAGAWQPTIQLASGKLWDLSNGHFFEGRFSCNYQFGASACVKGFNTYGGAPNTDGIVYPGNTFSFDAAFQYNFTKNWAIACDLSYNHSNRNRFSGRAGTLPNGEPAIMTFPSSEQWSLAPAIEYNWNENIGLIAGVWFTFRGRSSTQFVNNIAALNIYY